MKTEDLKALGLNDDQVQRVFAMNGEDMNGLKASVATLTAERDAAREQLADANKKLEGYDPEWKTKATQAQQQAEQQIAELKASHAAASAAAGLKFSSESAKKAFLADLTAKKLTLQDDGTLLGFDDFVKSYKQADPGAFAQERRLGKGLTRGSWWILDSQAAPSKTVRRTVLARLRPGRAVLISPSLATTKDLRRDTAKIFCCLWRPFLLSVSAKKFNGKNQPR